MLCIWSMIFVREILTLPIIIVDLVILPEAFQVAAWYFLRLYSLLHRYLYGLLMFTCYYSIFFYPRYILFVSYDMFYLEFCFIKYYNPIPSNVIHVLSDMAYYNLLFSNFWYPIYFSVFLTDILLRYFIILKFSLYIDTIKPFVFIIMILIL